MVCLQPWPLSRLRHISGFCTAGCGVVSVGDGRSSGGVNVVGCGAGPCGTVDESIPGWAGCGRIAGRLKMVGWWWFLYTPVDVMHVDQWIPKTLRVLVPVVWR